MMCSLISRGGATWKYIDSCLLRSTGTGIFQMRMSLNFSCKAHNHDGLFFQKIRWPAHCCCPNQSASAAGQQGREEHAPAISLTSDATLRQQAFRASRATFPRRWAVRWGEDISPGPGPLPRSSAVEPVAASGSVTKACIVPPPLPMPLHGSKEIKMSTPSREIRDAMPPINIARFVCFQKQTVHVYMRSPPVRYVMGLTHPPRGGAAPVPRSERN
jgi:hypothetical protein